MLPADGWGKSAQGFINDYVIAQDNIIHIALYGFTSLKTVAIHHG